MPTVALRKLFATLTVLILYLAPFGAFSQEGSSAEAVGTEGTGGQISVNDATESSPGTAADPITAAEQALPLGNGGADTGQAVQSVSAFSIFRVIITLAVVAAAIYGIVFFIKRVSRGSTSQDPFLRILASTPLGANRSAYVISVGSRAWLVGAAESGVSLISEIEEKDILDAMFLEDSRKSAETSSGRLPDFKSMLRRLGMPVESGAPSPDNIRQRSDRIKGL